MLKEKIIIVTGGNGLIGKKIVLEASNCEAIVINADLHQQEDMTNGSFYCDVTDTLSVDELVETILEKYGRIDGLVNNAYPRTADWGNKFEDITIDSWKKNIDMQISSCFYLCQTVLKHMSSRREGSIVNMASIYGVVGNDFTVYENTGGMTSPAAYSAIKGGLINFTRYLASYFGPYNIRINCVSPGGIENNQHPQFINNYEAKVPLRRLGTPADIAPAVLFLLSDGARYITGQNLIVDGGWTAI